MSWDDVRRARLWEARRTTAQHSHRPEYQMVALGPFVVHNPAANATSLFTLQHDQADGGIPRAIPPFDGVVRALSVRGHSNITAGSATFSVQVNGTVKTAVDVTLNATTPISATARTGRGGISFLANDTLAVQIATTAAYAPTTADWSAFIFVELKTGGQ